jgi:hypothetical protein
MKKNSIIAIVFASLIVFGCTDADRAYQTLLNAGFSDVEITGYSFFGCSEDDVFHTKFTARNAHGNYVDGVVCSGWFKGATIRF